MPKINNSGGRPFTKEKAILKKRYHKNTKMITNSARAFLMLLALSSSVSTVGEALNHKLDYSLTNEQSREGEGEREKGREGERETERETERQRQRETETERDRERDTVKLVQQLTVGLLLPAAQGGEPLVEVGSFAKVVVFPVASPHDRD